MNDPDKSVRHAAYEALKRMFGGELPEVGSKQSREQLKYDVADPPEKRAAVVAKLLEFINNPTELE